jgi:hypothetical protein
MSDGPEPPLFAGTILGLRAWTLETEVRSGEPRLAATFAEAVWEPAGAWTEARCRVPDSHWPGRHRAPEPTCMCGLYAFHAREFAAQSLYEEHVRPGTGLMRIEGDGPPEGSVAGVIEAQGRIEVHESGFRAERARVKALVAGIDWPPVALAQIESVAAIYRVQVLQVGSAADVLDYCSEAGQVLERDTVEELLEPEAASLNYQDWSPTGGTPAWGAPPPSAPAAPPAPERSRLQRALGRLGEAVVFVIVGTFMLFWYGMWAALGILFVGGLLFGWLDEEQKPLPARVAKVRIDPERCIVRAVVTSKRPLERLELRVTGRDAAGEGLGHLTRNVGPLAAGRSTVRVAAVKPSVCRAQRAFTVRVRAVFPSRLGRVAEASSQPPSTTESVS